MSDVLKYDCYPKVSRPASVEPASMEPASAAWLGAELQWERQLDALRREYRAANLDLGAGDPLGEKAAGPNAIGGWVREAVCAFQRGLAHALGRWAPVSRRSTRIC